MSPALAGGSLTAGPPGCPALLFLVRVPCVSPVCPLLQVSLLGIEVEVGLTGYSAPDLKQITPECSLL